MLSQTIRFCWYSMCIKLVDAQWKLAETPQKIEQLDQPRDQCLGNGCQSSVKKFVHKEVAWMSGLKRWDTYGKTICYIDGHIKQCCENFFRQSLKLSKAGNLEWVSKVFYFCMASWDKAEYAVRIQTIFLSTVWYMMYLLLLIRPQSLGVFPPLSKLLVRVVFAAVADQCEAFNH